MSQDNRKVLIDIEIQARAEEKIKQIKREIQEMDKKLDRIQNKAGSIGMSKGTKNFLSGAGISFGAGQTGEAAVDKAIEQEIQSDIFDSFEDELKPGGKFNLKKILGLSGLNTDSAKNLFGMIQDPASIGMKVARAMPYAALAFLAIEIGKLVYKKLTGRNGPFDLTFRRFISQEVDKARARELRQQVRTGEKQAIFVSDAGVSHPLEVVNTMELIRNRDIYDLDVWRVRKGYQF